VPGIWLGLSVFSKPDEKHGNAQRGGTWRNLSSGAGESAVALHAMAGGGESKPRFIPHGQAGSIENSPQARHAIKSNIRTDHRHMVEAAEAGNPVVIFPKALPGAG
jgi:hypothetical protein